MRQAVDAAVAGRPVEDAAREHPELARALERFGSTV
jgi:2,3-diketo-5-methylthiopentyl-1-phosphate enolase